MITISCKLCSKDVDEKDWSVHIARKEHQDNLPTKILVKGIFDGNRIAEIHQYFEQFGKLAKKEVVKADGYVIVLQYCYEDPDSYNTVVHKDHTFCAQKWEISWCKSSCSEEIKINKTSPFPDLKIAINTLLPWTHSFSEQIASLKCYVQSIKLRFKIAKETIHEDLCVIFSQIPGFDSSKIQFFGSTEMNLAIPGSNVDIHIQDILEDTVLGLLTNNEHFVDAQKISEEFPRIRCTHVATNMICDLKMGDKLVLKNNELIKYYIYLDEKIHTLLLVIKIWAKYHDLLTQSSSYSFYLLVIFLLQQDPYNLPNVVTMRKKLPPDLESGWNCAFHPIPWFSPEFQNKLIGHLVLEFFKFYESFDYISCIVAPFSGKAHQKTAFLTPYRVESYYDQYKARSCTLKLDCGLCIQDPFEHSRNVSSEPSLKSSGNFTWCCRQSLSLYTGQFPKLHELLNHKYSERVFTMKKPESLTRIKWHDDVKKAAQTVLVGILTYQLQDEHDVFSCTERHDVWTQRLAVRKEVTLPKVRDRQNTEFIISDILKNLPGNNLRLDPVVIRFTFNRKTKNTRVCVSGNNEEGTHLDHFLRLRLGEYLSSVTAPVPCPTPKSTAKDAAGVPFNKTNAVQYDKRGNFTQQVAAVFANFPYKDLQWRIAKEETLRDLSAGLMLLAPAMKIHVYGSAATNLQLAVGPIDVYIDCGPISGDFLAPFKNIKNFHCTVGSPKETWTLKYKHMTHQLTCVVTMGHKERVKTDRLIRYYISQDEKVWQLILIIKHWLRCHMPCQRKDSSYALYMLVIFYLQQEPYKLPAVIDFQRGVPPDYENGWNYAFAPLAFSSINLRSATILEVVEGFFKFYESFDYISYVLCPYAGYAIAKVDFLQPYNLPTFYQNFMIKQANLAVTNDVCLQDPFDHSQNLLLNFDALWGSYFATLCRKALPFMRKESQLYNICCISQTSFLGMKNGMFSLEKPEGYDGEEFTSCVKEVFKEIVTSVFQGQFNTDCGIFKYGDKWTNREGILKNLLPSLPISATELEKEVAVGKACTVLYCTGCNKTVKVECQFERNPVRAVFTLTGVKGRNLMYLTHYFRVKMVKFMAEMKMTPGPNIKEETEDLQEMEAANYPVHHPSIIAEPPVVQESIVQEAPNEPEKLEDLSQQPSMTEKIHSEEEGEIVDDKDDEMEEEEGVPDNFFDDFAKEDFLDGLEDLMGCAEEDPNQLNLNSGIKSCDQSSSKNLSSERQRSESSGRSRDGSVSSTDFSLSRRRSRTISRSRSTSADRRSRSRDRRRRRESRDKKSKRRHSSRRRRSRSKSRDKSSRRYGRSRRRSDSSRSRSPPRLRRRRFSSSERILAEARKQDFLREVLDKINGVFPAVAPVHVPVGLEHMRRPTVLKPIPGPVVLEQIPRPAVVEEVPRPVVLQQIPVRPISTQPYDERFSTGTPTECGSSKNKKVPDDDPLHKLFADKRLSFKDYLTILTKRQGKPSLTQEQLRKKDQVIERCEVFLRSGTLAVFRVRPSPQPRPKQYPSPIQKSMAKFKFTSIPQESEASEFSNTLHGMLRRVGIFSETYHNERILELVTEALSSGAGLNSNLAAQILEASLLEPHHCVLKRGVDAGTQTRAPKRCCDKTNCEWSNVKKEWVPDLRRNASGRKN